MDANRFRAGSDAHWAEHLYIPSIRAVGDLRTAGALIASAPLYVHNAGAEFPADEMRACYRAAGAPSALTVSRTRINRAALYDWLTDS